MRSYIIHNKVDSTSALSAVQVLLPVYSGIPFNVPGVEQTCWNLYKICIMNERNEF